MAWGDPVGEFGDIRFGRDELHEFGSVVVWPEQAETALKFGWRIEPTDPLGVTEGFVRLTRTEAERAEAFYGIGADAADP